MLLENQTFTYRQCPTEVDGMAKIRKIKGNTVKFNQLVENGDFATSSGWGARQSTISISGGIATVTPSSDGTQRGLRGSNNIIAKSGHKYFASIFVKSPIDATVSVSIGGANPKVLKNVLANVWTRVRDRLDYSSDITNNFFSLIEATLTTSQSIQYKNAMFIDLTDWFGSGNEPTAEEFEALFPLPYYAFNSGTLLPFLGEQIKTVGFNQWDEEWERGKYTTDTGEKENDSYRIRNKNFISVLPNTEYCIIRPNVSTTVLYYGFDKSFIGTGTITSNLFITPSNCGYVCFYIGSSSNPITTYGNNICINISDPNRNGQYESYKESIVNLPTTDYFADGMKSAGSVYDELSENKAVQNVSPITNLLTVADAYIVTIGGESLLRGVIEASNLYFDSNVISITSNRFEGIKHADRSVKSGMSCFVATSTSIAFQAPASIVGSTKAEFNTWLSNNPTTFCYGLAEPVEMPIASASLVSQNQEIPMIVEDDKLVAYSTAEVTEQSGFHDTKIKLSNDGVAYSAKFTLHVERKP